MKKLRIGVLFGGRSGEHEVSLMSAKSIIIALEEAGYEVVPIGITKDGVWFTGDDPLRTLSSGTPGVETVPVVFAADPQNPRLLLLHDDSGGERALKVDVIFPVLHGPFGEDGTIQGMLELAGVPYVGSGVAASAVGMDKALMRAAFKAHGLPLLDWTVIMRHRLEKDPEAVVAYVEERLDYPCFVKPANLGSSVGVSKALDPSGLIAALHEAALFDRKIIVEQAALGWREVECAVLGNDEPGVSIPGEIVPGGEFYDYAAKYIDDSSELIIPARISEQAINQVQQLSLKAFRAIDGAGLARVDFFVHPETEDIVINEINTMPGFTSISMYPKLWEATGVPYSQLVDRLVRLAVERRQDVARSQVTLQ